MGNNWVTGALRRGENLSKWHFFIINPTRTHMGWNPDLIAKRRLSNTLRHCTALKICGKTSLGEATRQLNHLIITLYPL